MDDPDHEIRARQGAGGSGNGSGSGEVASGQLFYGMKLLRSLLEGWRIRVL